MKTVEGERTLPIRHTREGARHELQATLPRLRGRVHFANIVDVEKAARHRDDQYMVYKVHIVHALGEVMRRLLLI